MTGDRITEAHMVDMLRRRFCHSHGNGPSAILLPQVKNGAGFQVSRIADALVMGLWPSNGLHLEGFEIKCSRSDLLRELRDPSKAEAFAGFCDRWWLVLADESHIKDGELPDGWGLLVKRGDRLVSVKVARLRVEASPHIPKAMLAAMLRQADRELYRSVATEDVS